MSIILKLLKYVNKRFILDPNTDIKELIKTSEIINKLLVGTPIKKVSERLELEIKPIIKKSVYQYETVYNIFYDALSDLASNGNIHVSGRAKIFEQPEYNDALEMKRLANKLEDMIKYALSKNYTFDKITMDTTQIHHKVNN